MNRLKHILGVNVPRHVPSMRRSRSINHSAEFRRDGAWLISIGSKTICKQCSKSKSSVMSLGSMAKGTRCYSTHQFNGIGTSKRRALQAARSYAEMIADYSEAIREASTGAVRNNSCFSGTMRRSLFGTLTSPSLDKKIRNIAERNGVSSKARGNVSSKTSPFPDPFDQFIESIVHDSMDIAEATSKSEDRSYAHGISVASNGALTPKSNVLARSSLESFATATRNASSANHSQGIRRQANRAVVETSRQSSTQVSTSTGASKQPQVELHMVPSAKESVVSINVDSARLSTSSVKLASDELSVVVRSNQKAAAVPRSIEHQWNAETIRQSALRHRGNFGPMRISISEDSAPVKQIEFSINGKPVSELKSIVARTERLDVVTSSDKIEIRVPFVKDDASAASGSRPEDELRRRSGSNMEQQVLNVQISANFQNEPTISTTPSPRTPAALDNDEARQRATSARTDVKADDMIKRMINERPSSKRLSADKSPMKVSTIERANDTEAGRLCARKIMNSRYPEANKNEPSDNRVPTDMIPWWSSSDGFNRMRKKEDSRKPSDWNGNKLPNTSAKLTESTNNSSDMISHWSSSEQREPTVHYSSLFRAKPNQKNPDTISEVMGNGLKVKSMQTLVMEKDNEEISGIKRTEPATLSALETTNVQSRHNASGELHANVKKTSVLPEKFKAPKNTQDSLLEQDRKKRNNCSPEKTHLIDDAFNIKPNVKDVLKPFEKRKDSSLIDYGLKVSSKKATMKLNGGVKEIRNPSPAITKTQDLRSKKSITEIAPKTEQINKTETEKPEAKRIISQERDDPVVKNLLTFADVKAPDENLIENIKGLKEDRPKNLSSISASKITETQKSGKLSSLRSSELNDTRHSSKGLTNEQMIQREKLPSATNTTKSPSRTKSNLTWKKKYHNPLTDSTEKNPETTSFTRQPADKLAVIRNAAVEIARQSSASDDLSKSRRENQSRKSKSVLDKRNLAGSTDFPKDGSASFKSADSKMRVRAQVKFSESRANFNRSQPCVIGSVSPWAHMDRPEKSALYSVWLQRFKSDFEKLF